MIKDHEQEIKQLLNEGFSVKEIADKLHIYRPSLYDYFSKHRDSFPKQRAYRRLNKEEYEQIFTDYVDNGMTLTEVANKHNISSETVRRYVNKRFSSENDL